MPRTCTVCTRPADQRQAIDAALIGGGSLRDIARQNGVSKDALFRHREHLAPALVKASDAAEMAQADDLLAQLAHLQADARRIGVKAEDQNDLRTALAAVRELVRIVELLGEMEGEISRATNVNILVTSPEWVATKGALIAALRPYPEARAAVVGALLKLEGGA